MLRRSRRKESYAVEVELHVGALFRVGALDETCEGDVLVRLLSYREDTGQYRFRMMPKYDPTAHFMEYPSLSYLRQKCSRIAMEDLSRSQLRAYKDLMEDPPTEGLINRKCKVDLTLCCEILSRAHRLGVTSIGGCQLTHPIPYDG